MNVLSARNLWSYVFLAVSALPSPKNILIIVICPPPQCKQHLAPYEGWPARFEWVTNWYYSGDEAQPPPLFPSALPLDVGASRKSVERMRGNNAGARVVIDLTLPEEGTIDNPIILM
ncbi:hypothetical protein C8T65DRAFT_741316 [Cerioporus squamosus]|nr:hypothetical protein C8T65DRAFT_741316 [Cerioporus squamosus]